MHSPIERLGVFRCRGYRCLESEGWTYAFFDGDEEVCSLFDLRYAMHRDSLARIQGFGLSLVSDFDFGETIYTGMNRFVQYPDRTRTAFRIVLQGLELVRFAILGDDFAIDVLPSGDGYAFFIDAREIGRLRLSLENSSRGAPEGYDERFLIEAELQCPIEPEQALAVLTFPALKFTNDKPIPTNLFEDFEWPLEPPRDFEDEGDWEDALSLGEAASNCACFGAETPSASRYEFHFGSRKICEVTCGAAHGSPVHIRSDEVDWSSVFDVDQTLEPGTTRFVIDNVTGAEAFRIVIGEDFQFMILLGDELIQVVSRSDKLLFYRQDALIAYIVRLQERPEELDDIRQGGLEYRFNVISRMDLASDLQLALFAYPLLRF